MDYPKDFDTAAFPAGKGIALSRGIAVRISIVFFLILCACGLILFCRHFSGNYPFLISENPFTNEWTVVTYPGKQATEKIPQYQIVQEKLVSDFIKNWFTISNNRMENEMRWQECAAVDCALPQQYNPNNKECTLFCMSDTKLFDVFKQKVLPEYTARVEQAKEQWDVEKNGYSVMFISPKIVTEKGSAWQVYTRIYSNINGYFNVLAFLTIDHSTDSYPATLGYYVKEFNAYRINQ